MSLEEIVAWIVIGGIAGLLTDFLINGIRVDLVGKIVVGILGAFIGGWLFDLPGIHVGTGFVNDVITALVGAVVLLLLRSVRRGKGRTARPITLALAGPMFHTQPIRMPSMSSGGPHPRASFPSRDPLGGAQRRPFAKE